MVSNMIFNFSSMSICVCVCVCSQSAKRHAHKKKDVYLIRSMFRCCFESHIIQGFHILFKHVLFVYYINNNYIYNYIYIRIIYIYIYII